MCIFVTSNYHIKLTLKQGLEEISNLMRIIKLKTNSCPIIYENISTGF